MYIQLIFFLATKGLGKGRRGRNGGKYTQHITYTSMEMSFYNTVSCTMNIYYDEIFKIYQKNTFLSFQLHFSNTNKPE